MSSTFGEMQQGAHGLVLTVDEFGGIAGLVTLKQLLEVIVGQVGEEGAAPEEAYTAIGRDTFRLDAGIGISEINEELKVDLPEGDYQTVAGFILIFGVLFIVGGIISFMIRSVLRIIPFFGLANSLAGMAAGVLVGFLLLSGVLTGIQRFPFEDLDETIDESALGTFLADNFDVVIRGVKLIPGDWDNELNKLTN